MKITAQPDPVDHGLTVVGALALSGVTTYKIVRDNMMSAIAGTLDAVANGNASAIERWSADRPRRSRPPPPWWKRATRAD